MPLNFTKRYEVKTLMKLNPSELVTKMTIDINSTRGDTDKLK